MAEPTKNRMKLRSGLVDTHIRVLAFAASADLLLNHPGTPLLIIELLLLLPRLLLLAADGLWVTVDVLDVPAFGGLINFAETW